MNILILGGAGFLGTNLVRYCLKPTANRITVVDPLLPELKSSLDNLKPVLGKINFIRGDIRDARLMSRVVSGKQAIFNCAGQTSHLLSLKQPQLDVDINCRGNITLLEAIKKHNPKALVIYPSSSTLIGKSKAKLVDENHRELPLDVYSANKAAAEKYYFIYAKVYGLRTLSLRFANLYGPFGKAHPEFGFINYFISQADKNKTITIYGQGRQTRNITYVGDAVALMYRCLSWPSIFGDIYFATHRQHHSVLAIAKAIVKVFGKGSIKQVPWPETRKRIEIGRVSFSAEKLFRKIGWQHRYSLKEGLQKTKAIIEKNR